MRNTKLTIDKITRTGIVTIKFSNPLKPPLPEDGFPLFNETENGFIFVNFTGKVE